MAAISDLNGTQLEQSLVNNLGASNERPPLFTIISDAYGSQILLNITALTGKEATSESQLEVTEFLVKLRELCAIAQIDANVGKVKGEKLNSFPPAVYGAVSDGMSVVTAPITARMSVSSIQKEKIIGVNI